MFILGFACLAACLFHQAADDKEDFSVGVAPHGIERVVRAGLALEELVGCITITEGINEFLTDNYSTRLKGFHFACGNGLQLATKFCGNIFVGGGFVFSVKLVNVVCTSEC